MNFREWLINSTLLSEGYTVMVRNGQHINLVAIPETKQYYTEIAFSEDGAPGGEFHIILRPLAGEAVANSKVGFKLGYLVCEYRSAEGQFEKQVIQSLKQKYGQRSLKWADDDAFRKGLEKQIGGRPLPSSIKIHTSPVLFILEGWDQSIILNLIKTIVKDVEDMVVPLIQKNLINYFYAYGAVDRHLKSDKYRQETQQSQQSESAIVGYLKYIFNTVLVKHPLTQDRIENTINRNYSKIQPSATKVDLRDPKIHRLIDEFEAIDRYIAHAVIQFQDKKLDLIEKFLKAASQNGFKDYDDPFAIVFLDYDQFEEFKDNWESHWFQIPKWALDDEFEKTINSSGLRSRMDLFKQIIKDKILDPEINRNELPWVAIYKHYDKLNLPKEVEEAIREVDQKQKKETEDRLQSRKQEAIRNAFVLGDDNAKYIVVGKDDRWHDIPNQFIGSGWGMREDGFPDIEIGKMVLRSSIIPLDEDGIYQDARERAEEFAHEHIKEKPSETYEDNDEEIKNDIFYDQDDFLEEEGVEDDEIYEIIDKINRLRDVYTQVYRDIFRGDSEAKEQLNNKYNDIGEKIKYLEKNVVNIIEQKYRDEFIQWKLQKLRDKEENEDAWMYEPDYESSEYTEKIGEIEEEIAEEMAWEEGLAILQNGIRNMEIMIHSKFFDKFKSVLKQVIKINREEKDKEFNEPIINLNHRIRVYLVDKNKSIEDSAYDWAINLDK